MEFAVPVTLEDEFVRLEPLSRDHADGLAAASEEAEHPWYASVPLPQGLPAEIDRRLDLHAAGSMSPFAIRRLSSGRLVGMTSFCHISQPDRRVEIGYTWITRGSQGTEVNPAAKRLLLTHAFDTCGAISVQVLTHSQNLRSRAAIERIGATLDGILRNHRILPDGSLRDTAVYSILPHEWPAVRDGLETRLDRHRAAHRHRHGAPFTA